MLAFVLSSVLVLVEGVDAPTPDEAASSEVAPVSPSASVYVLHPWTDGLLLGATTASWVVLEATGPSFTAVHCPCDESQVPAFDRIALRWHSQTANVASNVTEVLALLAPVGVDIIDVGFQQAFFEDMVVYAEVLSISGTVNAAAKYVVQRPRPYAYSTESPAALASSASYTSFFSGHTTATFGALTTLAMTESLRHGPMFWPWVLLGVVGTSVAVERVLAGQHFPSDVVVGAVVGAGTGVLVPWFHRRSAGEPQLDVIARPGGGELVLSATF